MLQHVPFGVLCLPFTWLSCLFGECISHQVDNATANTAAHLLVSAVQCAVPSATRACVCGDIQSAEAWWCVHHHIQQ